MKRGFAAWTVARNALSDLKNNSIKGMISLLGHLPFKAEMRESTGPIEIDIDILTGMGALISHALRLHAWAESEGVDVRIRSTCPLYSTGEDVFAKFFDRTEHSACERRLGGFATQWLVLRGASERLSLAYAQELMGRHFVPNAVLDAAIDKACDGDRNFDLSIHFRGTDKYRESGHIGRDEMIRRLLPFLDSSEGPKRVFLATDDAAFARLVRSTWPDAECVSYDLGEVPDGAPRHFSALTPSDKAEEALVNIFLLAEAPICIRTSSFMSSISRLANPALRTITINKTYHADIRFPENEILHAEASDEPAEQSDPVPSGG